MITLTNCPLSAQSYPSVHLLRTNFEKKKMQHTKQTFPFSVTKLVYITEKMFYFIYFINKIADI
jgi:hypothetical protein